MSRVHTGVHIGLKEGVSRVHIGLKEGVSRVHIVSKVIVRFELQSHPPF